MDYLCSPFIRSPMLYLPVVYTLNDILCSTTQVSFSSLPLLLSPTYSQHSPQLAPSFSSSSLPHSTFTHRYGNVGRISSRYSGDVHHGHGVCSSLLWIDGQSTDTRCSCPLMASHPHTFLSHRPLNHLASPSPSHNF